MFMTDTSSNQFVPPTFRTGRTGLLIACAVVTLLVGCSENAGIQEPVEAKDAELRATEPAATEPAAPRSATKTANRQNLAKKVVTESGAYLVRLRPREDHFLIGESQAWIASITDAQGIAFTPSVLYLDGGMPGHGHGLPSAPRFTQHLGGADYLLEGMTLNMPGDWRFVVTVGGAAGTDSAVFDLNIQPGEIGASEQTSPANAASPWSSTELALIESLRLDKLKPPVDESNRFLGNAKAIAVGEALFNEVGLSATGEVSCATCHQADKGFADGKRFSVGSKQTVRHTPALLGISHADWFYWDGRRDSLWAQAITPIETVGEMDNNRTDAIRFIANHPDYSSAFRELASEEAAFFPELSDTQRFPIGASPFGAGKLSWHRMAQTDKTNINRAYATLGKFLASFEATLQHKAGAFDQWASTEAVKANSQGNPFGADEQAGLKLFLDLPKTQCLRCHNGALFTNQGFHNVATSESLISDPTRSSHDFGRMLGLQAVIVDPFNCSGEFSDASSEGCQHLTFARRQNLNETIDGAFKVPSLRNLQNTAPYFHDGRFATLEDVMEHYRNQKTDGKGERVDRVSEVPDIDITDTERDQLVAFLKAL